MKNLKITEACLVNGKHAEAGTVLENVDNGLAADLVSNGRAVVVPATYEVIGNADPEVENREPKQSRKAKNVAPTE